LATIIPKPKGFMYRFDGAQQPKKFAQQQFDFLTRLMLRRQLITPNDTLGYRQPLQIIGPARERLQSKRQDTIALDSLQLEDFEF
jgi:hypothetical protein